MRCLRFMIMAVLAVAVLIGSAAPAHAAFSIRAFLNGVLVGQTTQAADPPDGTAAQIVLVIPGVGTLVGSTNSGIAVETPLVFTMTLSADATFNNPGVLVVDLSRTNVDTAPGPQAIQFAFTGSVLGAGGNITDQIWVDDSNTLFGGVPAPGATPGVVVFNSGQQGVPFAGSGSFNAIPPYSVTQRITLTATGAGLTTFSADNNLVITAVPAPAGLLLALGGVPILGVGALVRRRLAKKA